MGQVSETEVMIREAATRQTDSLLNAAWAVRDAAEVRRKKIRQAFELIAVKLCPQSVDRIKIAELDDQALFEFIVTDALTRLDEGEWYRQQYARVESTIKDQTRYLTEQLSAARQATAEIEKRLAQTKQSLDDTLTANRGYVGEVEVLKGQVKVLENALKDAQVRNQNLAPISHAATDNLPAGADAEVDPARDASEWLGRWAQSTNYRIDSAFLRLAGSSAECRRQALLEIFTRQERGRETVSGAEEDIVKRLVQENLLTTILVKGGRGNQPHLLALSIRGKEAYRNIFNEEPLSIYDRYMARHKSIGQIYLVLQVCDVLAAAGFQVDRLPPVTVLTTGRIFAPDLKISRGSETLFVEIETSDKYKNAAERTTKWHTIAEATRGHIYVVARDPTVAREIRSEIMQKRYQTPVSVGVTCLEDMEEAVKQGVSLWGALREVS